MIFQAQAHRTAQISAAENGVAEHTQLINIDGCAQIQPELIIRVMADKIIRQTDDLLICQACGWIRQLCFGQPCAVQQYLNVNPPLPANPDHCCRDIYRNQWFGQTPCSSDHLSTVIVIW